MASTTAGRSRQAATGPQKDRFLDAVVFISVALFILLATGVGVLALQMSLR